MKAKIDKITNIIEFIEFLNNFKSIERLSLIKENGRRESDAEHTWHLVMAVWLFSSVYDKEVDLLKCIKLALVHDLVEIYAGDVYAFDVNHKKDIKEGKEIAAIKKLNNMLPNKLGDEFKQLWLEYEKRETEEGKYVWALDKFMPRMQYNLTNGDLSDNLISDPTKKNYQNKQLKNISEVINTIFTSIE